jgi:hypothetical protein
LKGEDDEQYSWDQSEAQTKDYYTDSFIIKLHVSLILKPPRKKFHCKIKEPTQTLLQTSSLQFGKATQMVNMVTASFYG